MLDRRVRGEVFINAGFAAINVVGVLLSYSLAARVLAPTALDLLLLSRRLITAGANLTQLGVSQTLQRYLSVHAADQDRKLVYLQRALVIVLLSSITLLTTAWIAGSKLSQLISPGMHDGKTYCIWLGVAIVAYSLCFLSASLLLAERRVFASGVLQLLTINGFFIVALWWFGRQADVIDVIRCLALGTLTISATAAFYYCFKWRHSIGKVARSQRCKTTSEFVRFGIPRTLTSFLDAGIVLLGPWLLRANPGQTAAFLMALTVLRMTQATLTPISQVLGLGAARMIGVQREHDIGLQTRQIFGGLVYIGVLTPCLLAPWSGPLVEIWLANPDLAQTVTGYLNVLIWATTPLTLFYGLRSIVDMRWTFPRNLIALVISLVLQITFYFATCPLVGTATAVSIGVMAGLWALGLFTIYWLREDLRDWRAMGLTALGPLALVIWASNHWLANSPGIFNFFVGALFSAFCTIVACKCKTPEFVTKINSRQTAAAIVKKPAPAGIPALSTAEIRA